MRMLFIAAALLLGSLPAAPAAPAAAQDAAADPQTTSMQRGREIVQQAIATLGGQAYLSSRYRSGNGRYYTFSSTGELDDAGTQFWFFTRFPDAERDELTKKRDVTEIYNGDKGWEITYKGAAPMQTSQVILHNLSRDYSLDTVLRLWAANPDARMLYQGLNLFNQTQVDSVTIYNSKGESATVDFNHESHLPVRLYWRREDAQTGGHFEQSVLYGNWVKIDGVETALATQTFQGPQKTQQTYYDDLSYKTLPDSLFAPPKMKGH